MFLNPDAQVNEQTIPLLSEFLGGHPEVGAASCKMRNSDATVQELGLRWFPSPWTEFLSFSLLSESSVKRLARWLPAVNPHRSGYVRKLYGGCLMARKATWAQVGWLDDRYFMYAEDVDLCRSLMDQGWCLYYLSEAEIIHEGGATSRKAPSGFSILMKCESIGKLMRKYYGLIGHALYRCALCAGAALRLGAVGVLVLLAAVRLRSRGPAEAGAARKC